MAISYTYKVNAARVVAQDGLTDVVKEVEVTVTGTDGDAKFELPVSVKLSEADAQTFTAFSELTEEQIVSWISEDPSLYGTKGHIAYVVAKEVERLSMQPKPLPWAPAPTEDAPVPPAAPTEN